MTSPLSRVTSALATAENRRKAAEAAAAALWSDQAFRQLENRVLRPLGQESSRFAAAVQLLDTALGRALNDLAR